MTASLVDLLYAKDKGEIDLNVPIYSKYIDARVLAQNVAEGHTIPSGATTVFITATAALWINLAGTAAVPSADVTDGSSATLIPAGVVKKLLTAGATTLSMITDDSSGAKVSLEFYK